VRVLLVENDARVAETIDRTIRPLGHPLDVTTRGDEARETVRVGMYDLAILAMALPDCSGVDLCRELRAAGWARPILMLTADDVGDRVAGLDAGADDCLVKPFAPEELVARIRALLRRAPRWKESTRAFGRLEVDRDRRICLRGGEEVPLSPREFDFVALLVWRDGRVIPRDEVLERVWGEVSERTARSLDVLVARLRRKIDDPDAPSHIRTIRGIGYSWSSDGKG
jgi:DNA-binding response OmpR family regulator